VPHTYIDCDYNEDWCNCQQCCVHREIEVDDGNLCTDSCEPGQGIVHNPVDCSDNNVCTEDCCIPSYRCTELP
jgi:hypothetical protein